MIAIQLIGLVVASVAGVAIGFASMDALFGQPFLGKWWRKK